MWEFLFGRTIIRTVTTRERVITTTRSCNKSSIIQGTDNYIKDNDN